MLSPAILISLLYIGHAISSPSSQQANYRHHVAKQTRRMPRHWLDLHSPSNKIDEDNQLVMASSSSNSLRLTNKSADDLDFVTTFSGSDAHRTKLDKSTFDKVDDDFDRIELHTNNHKSPSVGAQLPASGFHSNSDNGQHSRHYSLYQHLYHQQHQGHSLNSIHSKKYGAYQGPSAYATSNLNLNYIHGLLHSKPSTLSSLLNFNSNSLPVQSSYGLPLQNNLVSPFYSASASFSQGQNQQDPDIVLAGSTPPSPKIESDPQAIAHQSFSISNTNSLSNEIDSNNLQNFSLNSIEQQPELTLCGRQQVGSREPRIVGGNSTYDGEFPWAVSIQRQGNHHCGGVIVGRRWILTAAHCVRSQLVGNLQVRTGGHTLVRSSNQLNSHLSRDYLVDQIVMHDDFSRYDNLTSSNMKSSASTNNADIALLRLKHEIVWNELAWPVCFPSRESGNFSGRDAVVIGWGKLNEKSEDFSNDLQKVKLTIIDNKVCQNWFRQAGREMPIDERIICAGFKNGGKDACHGDSGGPLLSKINGQYVVVGVVSTGIGCARPLLPGLYSRVSSYISWIERYISN